MGVFQIDSVLLFNRLFVYLLTSPENRLSTCKKITTFKQSRNVKRIDDTLLDVTSESLNEAKICELVG